jgi:hypothetical protein
MILTGKKGEREERCLKRARKQLKFQHKWGKLAGGFYLFLAICLMGLAILFCGFMYFLVNHFMLNPNNPPQANNPRNLATSGLIIGMLMGFLSGLWLFKGMFYLVEAIKYFRGDPTDYLLVFYHDLLLELNKDSPECSPSIASQRLNATE